MDRLLPQQEKQDCVHRLWSELFEASPPEPKSYGMVNICRNMYLRKN